VLAVGECRADASDQALLPAAPSDMEGVDEHRRVTNRNDVCCAQDVMMPDVDGIELLRHLRGNESFAAVPVVSAHAYRSLAVLALQPQSPPPLLHPRRVTSRVTI